MACLSKSGTSARIGSLRTRRARSLPKHDFDRMVKTAAGMLASKRICTSLNIKADEEKFRFGFTA